MDLAILKPKREPPVAANVDGPDSGTSAFEWVQPEAWYVHVFDRRCGIQGRELHPNLFPVISLDPRRAARIEEAFQARMADGLDHRRSVPCCAMRNKRH